MPKPFQVHARHMTDNTVRKVSEHATWDDAEAEAERLRNLPPARIWPHADIPVYTDVTVHPELEGIELAMAQALGMSWVFARGKKP